MVSVIKFRDEANALRIANGTAYSLAAGVWSRDMGRAQRWRLPADVTTEDKAPVLIQTEPAL